MNRVHRLLDELVQARGTFGSLSQKIDSLSIEFVETNNHLPSKGEENKLYVVKSDSTQKNKQTIYGFFNDKYHLLGGVGDAEIKRNQVTKLGVVAPLSVDINIEATQDFNRFPVEVLKVKPGTQNVVSTVCNFDNADATSFEPNEFVKFDGKMQLITTETKPMINQGPLGSGTLFSIPIDVNRYKKIEKIEVI